MKIFFIVNLIQGLTYIQDANQLLTALRRVRTSLIAVPALQFGGALCLVALVVSYRGVASVI